MLYLEGMFSLSFRLDISCSLNLLNLRTSRERRMKGGREISIPRVKQNTFSLLNAARSAQTTLNQMADVFESGIVSSSMWLTRAPEWKGTVGMRICHLVLKISPLALGPRSGPETKEKFRRTS